MPVQTLNKFNLIYYPLLNEVIHPAQPLSNAWWKEHLLVFDAFTSILRWKYCSSKFSIDRILSIKIFMMIRINGFSISKRIFAVLWVSKHLSIYFLQIMILLFYEFIFLYTRIDFYFLTTLPHLSNTKREKLQVSYLPRCNLARKRWKRKKETV